MLSFPRRVRPRSLLLLALRQSQQDAAQSSAVVRQQIQDITKAEFPIQKLSLSRGLAMNKFEKDFMIYPEYSDSDDVRNIEGFTDILAESLRQVLDPKLIEREKRLPDDVLQALMDSQVCAIVVPGSYEGLDMNLKDRAKIYEELSVDWNVFANVNISHTASQLLILFGSEEQKQKYLPLLASGKCRPAIAYPNLNRNRIVNAEVTGCTGSSSYIDLKSVPVIAAHNANVLIAFAKSQHPVTREEVVSCYIIDHAELKDGDKWEFMRDETVGLKAMQVGVVNVSTQIVEGSVFGEMGQGLEVASELACLGRLPLAAATIGYTKRLLNELAQRCNRSIAGSDKKLSLSSKAGAQRCASHVALKLYALESAVYYINGLLDESIPILVDIESALINKLTRELLHSCVSATIELTGLNSGLIDDVFEKNIRDISALLALTNEEATLEEVAISVLSTWAANSHAKITSTLKRLFNTEKIIADLANPKLQHFIAEHAHPSLQHACQELEFSMSRLNTVISKMINEQGKNLEKDFGSLESLVKVLQNHLCMIAVISRSSRSYAIGLRNADIELSWATSIATRMSRENWFELESMSDYFGLVRFNPSLLCPGQAIFDLGGYKIESPTEKNW